MRESIVDKFIGFLLISLIVFAIFLQITTTENTKKLKNEEILKTEQYAQKIVRLIELRVSSNLEKTVKGNDFVQKELNEILEAFLTKQYSYIFMLSKDAKGHYRFVLDGDKENPEEYGSVFFPKSKLFDKVYSEGKMSIIEQHDDVEGVWVSLVYPYMEEGKTEALLVLDLSREYATYLNNFNSPLVTVVRIMQVFLFLALLFLIMITYRYYQTRKILTKDSLSTAYTKYYLADFFNKNDIAQYYFFLVDIDEFKEFNKKYGNDFGNKLIQSFISRFQEVLGGKAKVVRVGTEFIAFVPKTEAGIHDLSEKLFQTMGKKYYLIEDEKIHISISMSAIDTPEESSTLPKILRVLDEELLKVKSQGKNTFRVLGADNGDALKYNDIDYIRLALEEERLLCLYQPICETQSKEIVKYEALARLVDKNDSSKLISPFQFMQLIKGTSQYIKMSKLVLSDVFYTLSKYPKIEISMNLDLDDLFNKDMMKLINNYLVDNKENAARLTFEIIEENEITDYERVSEIFHSLKKYGSKVAIDDFGSGYANYQYLIALDIDILKIDGSLIRELKNDDKRAYLVVESIKNLADIFNYEVVAEFVSDKFIYEQIKDLGIGYSQGYYLGEPRPINEYLS